MMAPDVLVAAGGVFVLVFAATAFLTARLLATQTIEYRRLRAVGAAASVVRPAASRDLAVAVDPQLSRLSRLLGRHPKSMSRLQRQLARAGYPQSRAALYYIAAELLLPVALAGAMLAALGMYYGVLPALFLGILGYAAPGLYVGHKRVLRQKAIRNGLPDALDLMTVCIEAGSGLEQALHKTSEEIRLSHPALADEIRMVITETRAGKPRKEAFKNFAQRTGVEDVRSLVAMLAQTDRFGTSIADALRIQADTSRTKRRQAAEERAARVGAKLVFPLALCLFPSLYVVCLGPVVIKLYHAFM